MIASNSWPRFPWLLPAAVAALAAAATLVQADPPAADPIASRSLRALVQGLREQPGLSVTSTMKIELIDAASGQKSEGEEVKAEFVYRKDGAGAVQIRDMHCIFVDGVFNATHASSSDKSYYTVKIDDVPYWTLLDVFRDLPYPHVALFWGDDAIEDLCMELHPRTPELVPTAVKDELIEGRSVRTLTLSSEDGTLVLTVDPEKLLIESAVHEVTSGPFVKDGMKMVSTYAFVNEVLQPGPGDERFVFDPGNRQRVDMVAALVERKPGPEGDGEEGEDAGRAGGGGRLAGKPAPGFVLIDSEGKAVDLKDLEGQVVVLDFWATWCPPCRLGLPVIHQAAKWVQHESLPVTVLTVNTFERGNSPDAKVAEVKKFWASQKFTLPVLMDYSGQTAQEYGISGIPVTVIIRSDGVVHTAHSGFPGSAEVMLNMLKNDIRAAIDELEKPVPDAEPGAGGANAPDGAAPAEP